MMTVILNMVMMVAMNTMSMLIMTEKVNNKGNRMVR